MRSFCIPHSHSASLFGGHKAVVRPVPIPNTAVKHSLADGSGFIDSARVGCRQSFLKSRNDLTRFGFFFDYLSPSASESGEAAKVVSMIRHRATSVCDGPQYRIEHIIKSLTEIFTKKA